MDKSLKENKTHTFPGKKLKAAVGLSGGVDSSVAALLLKEQGFDVKGVYMKCWDTKEDGCSADEDKAYAVQTAIKLGIEYETLDFKKEYKKKVISYFYDEYKKGRTPNPDVMCNREIKFGIFYKWAMENGFDYVATGHYARVLEDGGKFDLLKGSDPSKDQSYFLYTLSQDVLKHVLFPVGGLKKSEVRKLAKKNNLPSAERPESMGICFIGEVNIRDFLEKEIKHRKGKVLDIKGNVIGEHDGAEFFTVGQRHGFKLETYHGEPMYVVSKDTQKNELVVGTEKDLMRKDFEVDEVCWINGNPFEKISGTGGLSCDIRIRHLGKFYKGIVKNDSGAKKVNMVSGVGSSTNPSVGAAKTSARGNLDSKNEMVLSVSLDEPAFGVAPGQSCVFYLVDVVLGGGIIL